MACATLDLALCTERGQRLSRLVCDGNGAGSGSVIRLSVGYDLSGGMHSPADPGGQSGRDQAWRLSA